MLVDVCSASGSDSPLVDGGERLLTACVAYFLNVENASPARSLPTPAGTPAPRLGPDRRPSRATPHPRHIPLDGRVVKTPRCRRITTGSGQEGLSHDLHVLLKN